MARERRSGKVVSLFSVLDRVEGGAEVAAAIERSREEIRRRQAKARIALDIIVEQFGLDRKSLILQAAMNFVAAMGEEECQRDDGIGRAGGVSGLFSAKRAE